MTPNYETSKELSQYVKIETEFYWITDIDKNNKLVSLNKETVNGLKEANKTYPIDFYPAPTLEGLLRVSPIYIEVRTIPGGDKFIDFARDKIHIIYEDGHSNKDFYIPKSDNIAQAVAEIMLEYYRSKE